MRLSLVSERSKKLIKQKILIIHPDTRLNHSLVRHFVQTGHYEVFSSLSHHTSLAMITGVTEKHRFDVVVTHFGGLAIDHNMFVCQTKKATPSTRIMLFCKHRNLDGLRFDDVVFQDDPESIEILERRVALIAYTPNRV
jgi:hypothetical protein